MNDNLGNFFVSRSVVLVKEQLTVYLAGVPWKLLPICLSSSRNQLYWPFFSQSIIMMPGASQVIDVIFFPESLRAQWQWRWSLPKYRLVLNPWIKAINPNRIHGHETRIELLKICPWNTSPVFLLFILLHSSYPSSGHFFMENSFGAILVCYHMGSLASQLNVWRSVIHQPWVQRETWIFGRI